MRFRPGSLRLHEVLREGGLGEVQAATMMVPWWRPQSYYDEPGRGVKARDGGGVLITQAIHTLDLFRWLVGIERVEAAQVRTTALHRMETEDYASALVRLGNGAPGTIIATVAAWPGSPEWIHIIGSQGHRAAGRRQPAHRVLDGREEVLADTSGSGSGANVMSFSHEAHRAVLSDFLDAIEQGRDPAVPGEEALATQRVIECNPGNGRTLDAGPVAIGGEAGRAAEGARRHHRDRGILDRRADLGGAAVGRRRVGVFPRRQRDLHAVRAVGFSRIPNPLPNGMRASSEPYAALLATTVRSRLGSTWGLSETGATGPTGNRYGDAAGHTCIGLEGPEFLACHHAGDRQRGSRGQHARVFQARDGTAGGGAGVRCMRGARVPA